MMKRILAFALVSILLFCAIPVASASSTYSGDIMAQGTLNPPFEGNFFDPAEVLRDGDLSKDGLRVTFDGATFAVADIQRMIDAMATHTPSSDQQMELQRLGLEAVYVRTGPFYSRGPQHVRGVMTLNAYQSGQFQQTATSSHEVHSNFGVNVQWFEGSVGYNYSWSNSVTSIWDVTNYQPFMVHAYLNTVFMVHEYDVYNNTIFGRTYQGRAQFYEPFSFYTYWEQA